MALLATPKSFIMSHFETDPTIALEAPTTEVAFITLNDLKEKDALTTELDALNIVFQSVKGVHLPWALAFAREVPEKAFMLIGWDNAEAHIAAVYGPGGPTDIVDRIGKLAGLSVHHASFQKV
ncbi:hypothetical protein ONZ45_g4504 [Pleurotus djamor]|nr:hypothetical protein ONZ45_g4504 [Pleurotus djamor]